MIKFFQFLIGSKPKGARKNNHHELLRAIYYIKGEVMSAVEELKKAVSDLGTRTDATVAVLGDLKKQVAELTEAIVANPNIDADVKASADAIQESIGKLNSALPPVNGSGPIS